MPLGTRHELTGQLCRQDFAWILFPLEGGVWRLDIDGRAKAHAGRRVTVTGTRVGFDLLDVESIRAEGALPQKRPWWRNLLG